MKTILRKTGAVLLLITAWPLLMTGDIAARLAKVMLDKAAALSSRQ
jgi:hypothetical protein